MRARLAAIDLDGTLLRSDGTVSERTRAALRTAEAAGLELVLVTARSPRSVGEIAADLGLGGVALCANGATVYDLDGRRIVAHRPLPVEVAHRIVRGLRRSTPEVVFAWEVELRFGSEPAYEASRDTARWPRPEGSFPPCDPLDWQEPMTKLLARVPGVDSGTLLDAVRDLCGEDAEVTLAGTVFVEVLARGVTKRAAVAALAGDRGLDPSAVVAFGDQLVDAALLRWAGLGVAPANAAPAALEAADEVTLPNDEDGVAVVLERLAGRGSRDYPSRSASVGA